MAGHKITPYELYATRKFARGADAEKKLLLAAELVDEGSLDLLDAIAHNVLDVKPTISQDKTRTVHCVEVARRNEILDLVIACDVSGEQEVVRDPDQRAVVFMKGPQHSARIYSCCSVWRGPTSTNGLLVVHSPWGRGGSKGQILTLLQRALNAEEGAKAKLYANPKIPRDVLEKWLSNLDATKITYLKNKGIRSKFANVSRKASAPAEMALVVKGSETGQYRDALKHALASSANRDKFFTVEVRDSSGEYSDETFDDVELSINTGDGSTTYSMARDTIPSLGFDYTPGLTKVYRSLPSDDDDDWPKRLRRGARPFMDKVLKSAQE